MVVTGTVQVAEVQAGWQKPLDVKGLTWTEPKALGGRQLASVEQIRTTQALLDIVKGMACSQCLALNLFGCPCHKVQSFVAQVYALPAQTTYQASNILLALRSFVLAKFNGKLMLSWHQNRPWSECREAI